MPASQLFYIHIIMEPPRFFATPSSSVSQPFPGFPLRSTCSSTSSCIGTTSSPLAVSVSGGRSGSPGYKSLNSSLTLVRSPYNSPLPVVPSTSIVLLSPVGILYTSLTVPINRLRLLRLLHLLLLHLLPPPSHMRQMRRRGIRRVRRHRHPFLLPAALHILLSRHVQEERGPKGPEEEY